MAAERDPERPMVLRQGSVFVHTRWLDEDRKPLRCRVTRVARGIVYWRPVEGGSSMHFPLEDAARYVRELAGDR